MSIPANSYKVNHRVIRATQLISAGGSFICSLRIVTAACAILFSAATLFSADKKLDVNDISMLWPVPKTQADVDRLISADERTAESTVWPQQLFREVLTQAEGLGVLDASNRGHK